MLKSGRCLGSIPFLTAQPHPRASAFAGTSVPWARPPPPVPPAPPPRRPPPPAGACAPPAGAAGAPAAGAPPPAPRPCACIVTSVTQASTNIAHRNINRLTVIASPPARSRDFESLSKLDLKQFLGNE